MTSLNSCCCAPAVAAQPVYYEQTQPTSAGGPQPSATAAASGTTYTSVPAATAATAPATGAATTTAAPTTTAPAATSYVDPATGQTVAAPAATAYVDPATGQTVATPAGTTYVDPATGQAVSAPAATTYVDPATGQTVAAPAAAGGYTTPAPTGSGATYVDPNTGQTTATVPTIDPFTGQPVDPAAAPTDAAGQTPVPAGQPGPSEAETGTDPNAEVAAQFQALGLSEEATQWLLSQGLAQEELAAAYEQLASDPAQVEALNAEVAGAAGAGAETMPQTPAEFKKAFLELGLSKAATKLMMKDATPEELAQYYTYISQTPGEVETLNKQAAQHMAQIRAAEQQGKPTRKMREEAIAASKPPVSMAAAGASSVAAWKLMKEAKLRNGHEPLTARLRNGGEQLRARLHNGDEPLKARLRNAVDDGARRGGPAAKVADQADAPPSRWARVQDDLRAGRASTANSVIARKQIFRQLGLKSTDDVLNFMRTDLPGAGMARYEKFANALKDPQVRRALGIRNPQQLEELLRLAHAERAAAKAAGTLGKAAPSDKWLSAEKQLRANRIQTGNSVVESKRIFQKLKLSTTDGVVDFMRGGLWKTSAQDFKKFTYALEDPNVRAALGVETRAQASDLLRAARAEQQAAMGGGASARSGDDTLGGKANTGDPSDAKAGGKDAKAGGKTSTGAKGAADDVSDAIAKGGDDGAKAATKVGGGVDDVARGAGLATKLRGASRILGPAGFVVGGAMGVADVMRVKEIEGDGWGGEKAKEAIGRNAGGLILGGLAAAGAGALLVGSAPVLAVGAAAVGAGLAAGWVGEKVGGWLGDLL